MDMLSYNDLLRLPYTEQPLLATFKGDDFAVKVLVNTGDLDRICALLRAASAADALAAKEENEKNGGGGWLCYERDYLLCLADWLEKERERSSWSWWKRHFTRRNYRAATCTDPLP
jgi:hypothetical protein